MKKKITCSVVGARGYAGLETARLLLQHPNVELPFCFATSSFDLSTLLNSPKAKQVLTLPDSEIMSHLTDVVFLATPTEVSLRLAPLILKAGKKVIDLSGAFRLKANDYPKWYGFDHTERELLATAQYGLCPWVGPDNGAALIANPGCYATAIAMALIPVLRAELVQSQTLVIDAKSGTTGAGKKASENLLFTEVEGECLPYKVGSHQHWPEIRQTMHAFSGAEIDAHMTTSLLPIRRGIIAGIYAHLRPGKGIIDVEAAFKAAYQNDPLVKFAAADVEPTLLSLKKVVGTGQTRISYVVKGSKLYLFSCIDNLLKGAASQAVENLNRISNLPLTTGVGQLEAVI